MSKSKVFSTLLAVTFAAFLSVVDNASAAKKATYEQAWKICIDENNKANAPGTMTMANERYVRAMGCMNRHGYMI